MFQGILRLLGRKPTLQQLVQESNRLVDATTGKWQELFDYEHSLDRYDADARLVEFQTQTGDCLVCVPQIIGGYHHKWGTWWWAWNSGEGKIKDCQEMEELVKKEGLGAVIDSGYAGVFDRWPVERRKHAEAVKAYGMRHDLQQLTTRHFRCDAKEAQKYGAVANAINKASGVYYLNTPGDAFYSFLVLTMDKATPVKKDVLRCDPLWDGAKREVESFSLGDWRISICDTFEKNRRCWDRQFMLTALHKDCFDQFMAVVSERNMSRTKDAGAYFLTFYRDGQRRVIDCSDVWGQYHAFREKALELVKGVIR